MPATKKKTAKAKTTTIGKLFELMSDRSFVVSVNYYSDDQAPDAGKPQFYFMPYLVEVCDDEIRVDDMTWPNSTKAQILADGTAVAVLDGYTYLFRFYNLNQIYSWS